MGIGHIKQSFSGTVVLIALLIPILLRGNPEPFPDLTRLGEGPLAVLGDTQRTMFVEQYFLFREQNDDVRPRIIAALAKENPSALVLNGDLVAVGADEWDWNYFDDLFNPLRALKIPVWPVWGNHEYFTPFFSSATPLPFLKARFSAPIEAHWYWRKWRSLALVFLDSNDGELGTKWAEQKTWIESTIRELDGDKSVRGLVFFTHHPPFSNSLVPGTGDRVKVRDEIFPLFLKSKKSLLFVSSHSHGFQRFSISGKAVLVTGGGGGPRAEMAPKAIAKYEDLYSHSWKRPFNYVLFQQKKDRLFVEIRGLEKSDEQAKTIDQLELDLPLP